MATILPDIPLVTSPEIARTHRLLKQLPEEIFNIWHRLHFHPTPGPDYWLLHTDQRALWLKVSPLTPAEAYRFQQGGFFGAAAGRPADPEHQALIAFAQTGFQQPEAHFAEVPALILFPNLTSDQLLQLQPLAKIPAGVCWLSRDEVTAPTLLATLIAHLGPPLTISQIGSLRQAFTPEVVVPAQFTVRKPLDRNTQPTATPYLLDFDQERALKTDLELSPEARAAANDFSLRLINGVAGSGKSLVVVYRAQLLSRLYPQKQILGLTHNRPLIHDLSARYTALDPEGKSVKWLTFNQWCRSQWPSRRAFPSPIGINARRELLTQIWHTHLSETTISEQLFQDELDWCKDRLIFSREEYLAADRSGRGFALIESLRQKMYSAFEAYQAQLARRKQMDWGDVPRQLWRWIQAGSLQLPYYDVILIDEAQFFAPIWFELIKRSIKPKTGHLFLVADPTQGFLKRRQSWTASGLEVRGRVHRLTKSYRTTQEILNFATLLYRARVPADDDEIVPPDLLEMPGGTLPHIIPLTSEQDEITRVVNEVDLLLQQGVPKRHLLIIHTDWHGRERLLERLRARFGAGGAADPVKESFGDAIRVCTLNAVTGLESPIVILVGVQQLFEQEQSVRLSDDERSELVRDNTRRLYMAVTRAGQRLIMTYVGELPTVLQSLPILKSEG